MDARRSASSLDAKEEGGEGSTSPWGRQLRRREKGKGFAVMRKIVARAVPHLEPLPIGERE
jgi:hypothetical protein